MTEPSIDGRLSQLGHLIRHSPVNLVSRGDREQLERRHLEESRRLAATLPFSAGQRWVDLGTGGGLPGLVLAVVRPDVHFLLVDATEKKIGEVRRFRDALELDNVEARSGRAESLARLPELRGRFDGVVARALASLPVLAELARGFVRPGGVIAAVKGPAWEREHVALQRVASTLRVRSEGTLALEGVETASLVVLLRAVGRPPSQFPRPDGVPRRHPLA